MNLLVRMVGFVQVVILSQQLYIRDGVVKFFWYQTAHHPNTHRDTQTPSEYAWNFSVKFIKSTCYNIVLFRRRMSEQPTHLLDQSTDTDANQLGMMNECRTSEAWFFGVLFIQCFPFCSSHYTNRSTSFNWYPRIAIDISRTRVELRRNCTKNYNTSPFISGQSKWRNGFFRATICATYTK